MIMVSETTLFMLRSKRMVQLVNYLLLGTKPKIPRRRSPGGDTRTHTHTHTHTHHHHHHHHYHHHNNTSNNNNSNNNSDDNKQTNITHRRSTVKGWVGTTVKQTKTTQQHGNCFFNSTQGELPWEGVEHLWAAMAYVPAWAPRNWRSNCTELEMKGKTVEGDIDLDDFDKK